MSDRLIACFQTTFPEVAAETLRHASPGTLAEWDSLHTVILVAVLEEEFGIRIPTRDYPALRSYESVEAYLGSR